MSPLLLFPDFAIIALGYLLRRFWMAPAAWVTIEKLVYFVLFPCLLFFSVVSSNFNVNTVGSFALGGPTIVFASFLLGWLGLLVSKMGRVDFASGLQTAYRFNSYICLALASRLGGQSAVANIAILLALCVPLCNVLAVGTMSKGGRFTAFLEILKNPLIIGTSLGIAAKMLGIQVPEPMMQTLERLAQAAVSLGLLAVGSGLVFSGLKGNWAVSIWWLTVKLVAAPLVAVLYSHFMNLPEQQALVLLVFSAIPSASSAYILAARMGGNAPLVACLISMSTVGAAITLPLVFAAVQRLPL
ncbi:MAG: AEC family transporter [Gammaproteobacteria bacterium]|nr:AEC family transporter [Gammaproteobacteria bacterium]MBU0848911.1 AEC family transporter [Gammaproteobacteria bacterium]MBU1267245.1 AEC family transporter [Gammaproteobacteria bacterium]MBU1527834.1 AEC family transporter [Gammaproteobacteria bacterium]MBU1778876.1 AEC family transporter [Gammaproteobacteria bacterium]